MVTGDLTAYGTESIWFYFETNFAMGPRHILARFVENVIDFNSSG